jgi:Polyketide cyclase / dehydrase and lipid transport
MWYIMTPPQPVTVSIDVPQSRSAVYAYLDVMANHERFTDHMLTNWRVSGPPTGVGSKAHVTAKVGAISDESEIEVFEVEDGRLIRERSIAAKGKRIAHGTYTLSDLPGGGTHIEFEFALQKLPALERPLLPLMRKLIRKGNERAMERLAALLNDQAAQRAA